MLPSLLLQKMKEDNQVSQLGDYDVHSVNNNTRMDLVIFLYSNSNHLISLIPPKTASNFRHLLSCGTIDEVCQHKLIFYVGHL